MREELGRGQYGVVHRCVHRATGEQLACKHVSGSLNLKNPAAAMNAARREIRNLMLLEGCSHVAAIKDVYRDVESDSLYLVMELCTGGDLLRRVEEKGRVSEREARSVFRDMAMAVRQCHERSVVHRDIKLENVLLCPKPLREMRHNHGATGAAVAAPCEDDSSADAGSSHAGFSATVHAESSESPATDDLRLYTAKLGDFGISIRLLTEQEALGYGGSFPYEAPEMISGEAYDHSADIWSLGVTLYAMLSGCWPAFEGGERRLDEGRDWANSCWWFVSRQAKDLVRRMLSVDPEMRPKAEEILKDPWLRGKGAEIVRYRVAPMLLQSVSRRRRRSPGVERASNRSAMVQRGNRERGENGADTDAVASSSTAMSGVMTVETLLSSSPSQTSVSSSIISPSSQTSVSSSIISPSSVLCFPCQEGLQQGGLRNSCRWHE
ncbi:hypothetical protein CLOM_g22744 [Closterium sp. NIES-68]|nr:hypothetical protein CLOM_g22744 [Closterium sp. NIES-68]GJP60556.1 hypothetical protein CLOP_g17797 [Closterium sp. NIES-67]